MFGSDFPMTQGSEPEQKPEPTRTVADETLSASTTGNWGSEASKRLLRYYNWGTGKCDLTEEQADEQARRRRAYDQSCIEESERRAVALSAIWKRTPLEPAAKSALRGTSLEIAWQGLLHLTIGAIDESYSEANEIATALGLGLGLDINMDLEDMYVMLSELNPIEGVNQFSYVNPDADLSDVRRKMSPLEALKGMVRIIAVSDRPIQRNQWADYVPD